MLRSVVLLILGYLAVGLVVSYPMYWALQKRHPNRSAKFCFFAAGLFACMWLPILVQSLWEAISATQNNGPEGR